MGTVFERRIVNYSKILITGATGFIGSRLCEKFRLQHGQHIRALVRNFNNAARIGRLDIEMVGGDLADLHSVTAALSGCDAVVHLAFDGVTAGEKNLLTACRRAQIKRFVHISSMAVHGPNPSPEFAHEELAVIRRYKERYSDQKARAEELVQQAIAHGLPGVILRPTIVYGPYSPFVIQVVQAARTGAITLIDGGNGVCNAVYVDDVCDAIRAALQTDNALGKAFFINADRAISWREFNLTFANMITPSPLIESVSAQAARAYWASRQPTFRSNASAAKRLLVSSEFHDQLSIVPALRSAIAWTKASLKTFLSEEQVIALKNTRSTDGREAPRGHWPSPERLIREDFHVEFSNMLAKNTLGWTPANDFPAGATMTRAWLEFTGMVGPLNVPSSKIAGMLGLRETTNVLGGP